MLFNDERVNIAAGTSFIDFLGNIIRKQRISVLISLSGYNEGKANL
jgi:hypothetical protein